MKALVVYESMFGNTKLAAEAVARGLAEAADVEVLEVGSAEYARLEGVDLLVIGGPTHAWSMSRPLTRRSAQEQSEQAGKAIVSRGEGLREWLKGLPAGDAPVTTAVFDTSMRRSGWFPTGSAARSAARRLAAKGLHLAVDPEQFFVAGMTGPLAEGEAERAVEWGRALAVRLSTREAVAV